MILRSSSEIRGFGENRFVGITFQVGACRVWMFMATRGGHVRAAPPPVDATNLGKGHLELQPSLRA